MALKMNDAKMAIALLAIVANQERVERLHNYTYGDSTGFLNRLMTLLGRHAVYADGATSKGSTILKKFNILKSLWESIMAEEV
jgi:hypothetical protein